MNKKFLNIISLFLFLFFFCTKSYAGYDYINISNPFLNKIPIAITSFKNISKDGQGKETIKEIEELLHHYIKYIGFFNIIDKNAFIQSDEKIGSISSEINFRDWSSIGTELLLTTIVKVDKNELRLEFRLFDTFKSRLIVGKIYRTKIANKRKTIKTFCDSIIKRLTGKDSIYNSKIAFVSTVGKGAKEIFACDFDGYAPKRITNKNSISVSPAWSYDGRKLAFVSYEKGEQQLYIKNLITNENSVMNFNGITIAPEWAKGSNTKLATTLSISGDQEIYFINTRGKIIKRLTKNYGIDISPTFSPSGKNMAFVSRRSGSPQIYIKNLRDNSVRRLTYTGRYNTSPSWSPIEDKIVFESVDSKKKEINICIINADGSNFIQLTSNSGANESPSWSPDGSLIAFASNREGVSRIYVMNNMGTEQRRLLLYKGEQTFPVWSPANIK